VHGSIRTESTDMTLPDLPVFESKPGVDPPPGTGWMRWVATIWLAQINSLMQQDKKATQGAAATEQSKWWANWRTTAGSF